TRKPVPPPRRGPRPPPPTPPRRGGRGRAWPSARPPTAGVPAMSTGTREPAIARAMRPVNSVVEKYIPSALNFAILLSVAVGLMALLLTDAGPADVLRGWGEGLAGLLAFMTQMALILLLGHALANT